MPVEHEKISSKPETLNVSELRLLSINKASKILGIRYKSVQKLVRRGRIKAVTLTNGKYKIPYKNLIDFINGDTEPETVHNGIISLEETQNKIDALIKEYSNHGNNF